MASQFFFAGQLPMLSTTRDQLEITECRLRLARPLSPGEATRLRGYFGTAYGDEVLLHHHEADGRLLYDYPRIQFRVIDGEAQLIGIEEGGSLVERLWREADAARIGPDELAVVGSSLLKRREPFGPSSQMQAYRFRSAWLGLNQENHHRYQRCQAEPERRAILERVLIGNCLAVAKSFGQQVSVRLTADAGALKPRGVRLKGVSMLGFVGSFLVNFQLPGGIGIGKSVSRGHGAVEPLERDPGPC
jgi:hypothetical protein